MLDSDDECDGEAHLLAIIAFSAIVDYLDRIWKSICRDTSFAVRNWAIMNRLNNKDLDNISQLLFQQLHIPKSTIQTCDISAFLSGLLEKHSVKLSSLREIFAEELKDSDDEETANEGEGGGEVRSKHWLQLAFNLIPI